MNKFILILVALVLLVGAYFAYSSMDNNQDAATNQSQDSANNQSTNSNTTSDSSQPKSGQTKSLADLGNNGPQKCDLTITPPGSTKSYKGKFYTDGAGKFRSELESAPGATYYMINADSKMYNWSNQNKQGFTRATPPGEEFSASTSGQAEIDQTYDFQCSRWSVDSSLLTPPSDIKFSDMKTMPTNPYNR